MAFPSGARMVPHSGHTMRMAARVLTLFAVAVTSWRVWIAWNDPWRLGWLVAVSGLTVAVLGMVFAWLSRSERLGWLGIVIACVVVVGAGLQARQQGLARTRDFDATRELLIRVLTVPLEQERPSIVIYRLGEDSESRHAQQALRDLFASAHWVVDAPDEPLVNAPPLAGLGWVRFRGPQPREVAGRSADAQAALVTRRLAWTDQLRQALEQTGERCVIDDRASGSTVQDTWLGYIYVGPLSDDFPAARRPCRVAPGELVTVPPR
jgi:hypothetical protein